MKLRHHCSKSSTLEDIFAEDDDLGLWQDLPTLKAQSVPKEEQVLLKFREIEDFVRQYNREPSGDAHDATERSLGRSLSAYRERADLRAQVIAHDALGLLTLGEEEKQKPKAVTTLDDVFADDDLGLLEGVDTSILVSAPKVDKVKEVPDEIATRKPCQDFYKYEKLFVDLQEAIVAKKVLTKRFSKKSDVTVGQAFILRGLLCYVDSVLDTGMSDTVEASKTSGAQQDNPRLRVIFSNGTEADLLKLSLARAMYKDAQSRIVDCQPNLFGGGVDMTTKNKPTGFIYILATKSTASALAALKAQGKLVKIGYTTHDVEERVKHAEKEATFLEAPVRVLAVIECFNLNPQKFEKLIHTFLYQQRLDMTLMSADGTKYQPEEWFCVDRDTAIKVCECIVNETITQYRMDNVRGEMVRK